MSSFDISIGDALPVIGLLAVILVLAFYPQFGLRRSEATVRSSIAAAVAQSHGQLVAGWWSYAPLSGSRTP